MQTHPTSLRQCQIKVCGIRDPGDAAALDALGMDWLGFNFHPGSSRHITPEAAAPLIRGLRRAKAVGVFVDADPEYVREVVRLTGIGWIQLHGAESWEYVASMPARVIKAIPHDRLHDLGGLREGLERAKARGGVSPLEYLLVDTAAAKTAARPAGSGGAVSSGFGGSGRSFDWKTLDHAAIPLPFFLAGGLGPGNLREALAVAPFAVDLNSKVESAPGKKDLQLVRACVTMVRGAAV